MIQSAVRVPALGDMNVALPSERNRRREEALTFYGMSLVTPAATITV